MRTTVIAAATIAAGAIGYLTTADLAAAAPGDTATVCPSPAVELDNGSFEDPRINPDFPTTTNASNVPGWSTTAPDGEIELWPAEYGGPAADGTQYAELNANFPSTLYQVVPTTPGAELTFAVSHRGRHGVDVADIEFGPVGGPPNLTRTMSDSNTAWGTYTGSYTVPPGQTSTRIAFVAVSTSSGSPSEGNFLDNVRVGTPGCVTVSKTVTDLAGSAPDAVAVGDTLEYTIEVANPGGAAIAGPRVLDTIPTALAYVPESVRVLDGPRPGPRTDADDGDGVTVTGQQIEVDLATGGPSVIPAGASARFTFQATATSEAAGQTIDNTVNVDYIEPRLGAERTAVSDAATVTVLAAPLPAPTSPPSAVTTLEPASATLAELPTTGSHQTGAGLIAALGTVAAGVTFLAAARARRQTHRP